MAYSFYGKAHPGFMHPNSVTDDWLAMHIKEVDGHVVSTNQHANGAFAVLHPGSHDSRVQTGLVEYHESDPQGLHTHIFNNPDSTLRALTCEFKNRTGTKANVGRIHLWFKVCVSHA